MRANDRFYRLVCALGRPILRLVSRPVVLHAGRSALPGGAILAANHTSPYDVPCLMGVCRRPIDFVSIVELMDRPLIGSLFRALNCMPLDRHRLDSTTAREILKRLRAGRMVGMFPEGRIRTRQESVLEGGGIVPGLGQLAQLAGVPILPCLTLDTANFARPAAWLPLRRTRFAVVFGEPLYPPEGLDRRQASWMLEEQWQVSVRDLHKELRRTDNSGH